MQIHWALCCLLICTLRFLLYELICACECPCWCGFGVHSFCWLILFPFERPVICRNSLKQQCFKELLSTLLSLTSTRVCSTMYINVFHLYAKNVLLSRSTTYWIIWKLQSFSFILTWQQICVHYECQFCFDIHVCLCL